MAAAKRKKKKNEEIWQPLQGRNVQLGGSLTGTATVNWSASSYNSTVPINYTQYNANGMISGSYTQYPEYWVATYADVTTPTTWTTTNITINQMPMQGLDYEFNVSPLACIDENKFKITDDGKIMVNGKVEMNPTVIGRMLLQLMEKRRSSNEDLNDAKDFFNKD